MTASGKALILTPLALGEAWVLDASRRRLATVVAILAITVVACAPVPSAPPAPSAPAASEAVSGVASAPASAAAGAAFEVQLRDWLRASTGMGSALGAHAADLLAAEDAAEDAFGKAGLAAAAEKFGLPSPTGLMTAPSGDGPRRLGQARAARPAGPLVLAAWRSGGTAPLGPGAREAATTGSLLGNTSFTLDAYLGMAQQFIQQAGGDTTEGGTLNKTESHDSTVDGIAEHLTLSEQVTASWGGGRVSLDVTLHSDSVFSDAASGAAAGHKTTASHGVFVLNGCPTADGVAEGHYTVSKQESVTGPGGDSHGGTSSVDGAFRVLADDAAQLVKTEYDANVSTEGGGGTVGDFSLSGLFPIQIDPTGALTVGAATNQGGNGAAGSSQAVSWLLAMASGYLDKAAKEAEAFWRSGACIDMQTSRESGKVKPSEKVELTVAPIGKFDKAAVSKPIEAAFTGTRSLDPSTPQAAPATFTFIAGPAKDDKGTIDLKQTSRRGIGKKTLVFTVGSGRLLVTIRVTGSVVSKLGNVRGSMTAAKVPLEPGELSDTGSGTMTESGTFSLSLPIGGSCSGAFSGTRPITLEVVRDPTDDTRATLTFTSTQVSIPFTARCPPPAPSYPLDAGTYGTGWLVPLLAPVDLQLGTPRTLSSRQTGVISSVTVTIAEEPPVN